LAVTQPPGDQQADVLDRRDALLRLMAVAVAPALPQQASYPHHLSPSARPGLGLALPADPSLEEGEWKPRFFDDHQNQTLVLLSDLIIPDTDTPGAKAARVNRFIDLLLSASAPETQKEYLQALNGFDGHCLSQYGKPFIRLNSSEQLETLTLFTHENSDPNLASGMRLFEIVKDSIVHAYYSSEIGLLQELRGETNPFQPAYPGCRHGDGQH